MVRGRGGVRGRGQQPCYGYSRSSTKGWVGAGGHKEMLSILADQ
jgi:hypothetical protein